MKSLTKALDLLGQIGYINLGFTNHLQVILKLMKTIKLGKIAFLDFKQLKCEKYTLMSLFLSLFSSIYQH